MPPKRKAPPSRRSAKGDGPSSPGASAAKEDSDVHIVKRPRIEGEDDESNLQDSQLDEVGEEEVSDRGEVVEAEGAPKKKRGRPRGSTKKAKTALEVEEVHVQASLKAPMKRGRGRPPKTRPVQEEDPPEEEEVDNVVEEHELEAAASQNNEEQPQYPDEAQDIPHNGVSQSPDFHERPDNEAATPQNEDANPVEEESPPAQHPSPEDASPSPRPDVPPEHIPPHMGYEHAPPPPHPYGYPYGYPYPPPNAYPPPPPPPGMEYSSSFSTVDTSQAGSFASSYSMDSNAPAGNPFPPPPHANMYHPYAPPMPMDDDRDHDRQSQASGSGLALTPVMNERPPPGHPIGVPYTGPDGRKRVPVRPGGSRGSRGEHVACHFCRGRKLKCDGRRPTCGHCALRSLACAYDDFVRRRGPGKKEKNSRRTKPEPAVDMSIAALASAGMHMGTIDMAPTPPPEPEPSPSPVEPEPPTETRVIRRRRSKYNQPEPADPSGAKPRPYIGPMPTPDPPRPGSRRRRIPANGGVLRLNPEEDGEEGGSNGAPQTVNGLKPGPQAYAVGSNERLANVGGYYYAAPAGSMPAPPPPPPGQFYPGYVPVQTGGEGEEDGEDEYQPPQEYPTGQHAWPAEPPGHM